MSSVRDTYRRMTEDAGSHREASPHYPLAPGNGEAAIVKSLHPVRALLLVDFQRDFLADDGKMPVARNQVPSVLASAQSYIGTARAAGVPIIKIGNEFKRHDLLGNLLRRRAAIGGTDGTAWDIRVDTPEASYIPKWKPSAFCNPTLQEQLCEAGVNEIAIAGLFASACVTATTKAALKSGLTVLLLAGAIACRTDASRRSAFQHLTHLGAKLLLPGEMVTWVEGGPAPRSPGIPHQDG